MIFCIYEVLWWVLMFSRLEIFRRVNLHRKTHLTNTLEELQRLTLWPWISLFCSGCSSLPSRPGRSCRSEGRRVRWVDNSSSSSSTNTLFVQSSVCNASLSLSHSPSGRIAPPAPPPPPSPKGGHFQFTVKVGVFTHRPLRPLWQTAGTRTAAMADEALINRLLSAN